MEHTQRDIAVGQHAELHSAAQQAVLAAAEHRLRQGVAAGERGLWQACRGREAAASSPWQKRAAWGVRWRRRGGWRASLAPPPRAACCWRCARSSRHAPPLRPGGHVCRSGLEGGLVPRPDGPAAGKRRRSQGGQAAHTRAPRSLLEAGMALHWPLRAWPVELAAPDPTWACSAGVDEPRGKAGRAPSSPYSLLGLLPGLTPPGGRTGRGWLPGWCYAPPRGLLVLLASRECARAVIENLLAPLHGPERA